MRPKSQSAIKSAQIQFSDGSRETHESRPKNSSRSTLSQAVAMFIVSWLGFDMGMIVTMPTLVLGALHENPAEYLNMNDEEASWIGSLLFFAHPIGALSSGYLQELLGRRGSMLFINIPIYACWSALYFADSIYQLNLIAVSMGLSLGLCEAPVRSYIGEVAEPHLRGTMSTMNSFTGFLGGLVLHMLGYLRDWRFAVLASSVVPVITFIGMTQIPESPTWLIMSGRLDEAQKSLGWCRGWLEPHQVQQEYQHLLKHIDISSNLNRMNVPNEANYILLPTNENDAMIQQPNEKNKGYLKSIFRDLTEKKLLLPLRMVLIIFFFSSATNLLGMRPFLVHIFNKLDLPIDSQLVVALSRFCLMVGSIMNMVFLRRLGKRRLALSCQAVTTLSILLLGVYCSFYTRTNQNHIPGLIWIPMLLIVSVHFFAGFGVATTPWQLCSEVFPFKGRGTAQGIAAAWNNFLRFGMSKTYLYMERRIDLSGSFFFYGGLSVLGYMYYLRYLPETEGKTFEQIESYFTKGHDESEKFSLSRRKEEGQSVPYTDGEESALLKQGEPC